MLEEEIYKSEMLKSKIYKNIRDISQENDDIPSQKLSPLENRKKTVQRKCWKLKF